MWNQAEFTIQDLVKMAVACFEDESEDQPKKEGTNTKKLDKLMSILIEKLQEEKKLTPEEYDISEQSLRQELRQFLSDIKQEDEPGQYFEQNIGELHKQLGTTEKTNYTIGFPLNLRFRPQRKQDVFSALGHEIERMEQDAWLSEFQEPAEQIETQDDQNNSNRFTEFMKEVPNDFSWSNHTFWKFEMEARDQQFVVDRLEKVLDYLLGKINIAAHAGVVEGSINISPSVWPSRWSELRHPFVYIVTKQDDSPQFYYDSDISPRNKFRVHGSRTSRYDILFDEFPEITYPLNQLDERFVEAVRHFQAAVTEPDREASFLEYWRGIEALALTTEDDGMDTVIQRAEAPLEHDDHTFFRYRLKRARNKRNKLVHDGVDIPITRHDQNLLKSILEELIWIYCANLDQWDVDDFRFYLDNVGQETKKVAEIQKQYERKTELLRSILDAQQYEETIFEQILRDWAAGRSHLENVEFTDPMGFFHPIFGIGDGDADIMIIADAPTYSVCDEEVVHQRSRVRGLRPDTTTWESVDQYREFQTKKIAETNPGGTQDILEAVASAIEQDPDEIYYTTLQKDGTFDESLEETEDGRDPVELNEASITGWKPYLEGEIEHVDPDLIIVFGNRTVETLVDLLGRADESIEDVPYRETYVLDKYPILRFDHWSSIEPSDGTTVETHIKEIVNSERD